MSLPSAKVFIKDIFLIVIYSSYLVTFYLNMCIYVVNEI